MCYQFQVAIMPAFHCIAVKCTRNGHLVVTGVRLAQLCVTSTGYVLYMLLQVYKRVVWLHAAEHKLHFDTKHSAF